MCVTKLRLSLLFMILMMATAVSSRAQSWGPEFEMGTYRGCTYSDALGTPRITYLNIGKLGCLIRMLITNERYMAAVATPDGQKLVNDPEVAQISDKDLRAAEAELANLARELHRAASDTDRLRKQVRKMNAAQLKRQIQGQTQQP